MGLHDTTIHNYLTKILNDTNRDKRKKIIPPANILALLPHKPTINFTILTFIITFVTITDKNSSV